MTAATSTGDLLGLLQRHYIKPGAPLPGGVFLPEVGQNGGWGSGSRCDAIYVGFTSSSGRMLVGHEVKVSRSDWLNELNKPGKADAWADECHEWWLVVSDPEIVREGELPAHWGLMSPGRSKTRMQVHTRATRKDLQTHRPSWNAVRSVVARFDTLRAEAISNARSDAYRAATAEVDQRVETNLKAKLGRLAEDGNDLALMRDRMRALEKALGVNIQWDENRPGFLNHATLAEIEETRQVLAQTRQIKAAVRRLTGVKHGYQLDDLQRAIDTMRDALAPLGEQVTRV